MERFEVTCIHHSVARGSLHIDAICRRDDLGVKGSSVGKQAIVCIALKLLNIGIVVWPRHCKFTSQVTDEEQYSRPSLLSWKGDMWLDMLSSRAAYVQGPSYLSRRRGWGVNSSGLAAGILTTYVLSRYVRMAV